MLRHRIRRIACHVFYLDSMGIGIVKIDIIHAGGGESHQFQMGCTGKSRFIHRNLVDDDHIRIPDPLRNLLRLCQFVKGHMSEL